MLVYVLEEGFNGKNMQEIKKLDDYKLMNADAEDG